MRILIIGGGGMLGHKLVQAWKNRFDVWTTLKSRISEYEKYGIFDADKTFDLVDVEKIKELETIISNIKPQVIFNAVGIIKQLPSSKNVIKTLTINSIFPHQLTQLSEKYDSRLFNISTDCVFDGKKGNYTEDDLPNADDLYGKSKNLGEVTGRNCLTLRTSIIGRELNTNHSLVEWFLSNRGKKVKGFANAIYSGFPTIVLADIIANLIENFQTLNGLYHISSEPINKFELLKIIKNKYQADIEIERDCDFVIDRSLNSAKFRTETGFVPQSWGKMVEKMANDSTNYAGWKK